VGEFGMSGGKMQSFLLLASVKRDGILYQHIIKINALNKQDAIGKFDAYNTPDLLGERFKSTIYKAEGFLDKNENFEAKGFKSTPPNSDPFDVIYIKIQE